MNNSRSIGKLRETYNFPKRAAGVSIDGRQPFPNVGLDNWILLDAKIESNQKIRLKVKAIDTGDEGNNWVRARKEKEPSVADAEQFLKLLLKFKGKNLLEIAQKLGK